MRRICVVTGNRAEYSRVKTVMREIKKRPDLDLILVVTGSHLLRKYGMTIHEIERDGFHVDEKVYLIVEGENPVTMAKSTGLGIIELATVFNNYKPDFVIAPTDRFETLPVAITSAYMNIPLVHIQGGEISGTIDESIRHAITKFAHLHFPATERSRKIIIRMGEPEDTVFNVGCPATDLLLESPVMNRQGVLSVEEIKSEGLDPTKPYLLVVQHPVTTEYGKGYAQIEQTLQALKDINIQTLMTWPNADAGSEDMVTAIRRFFMYHKMDNIFIYRHFSNDVFINLMRNAVCMVGNSSAGIREACYFGTPVVNIGTRQQGRERAGNVMDVDYDSNSIKTSIEKQLATGRYPIEKIYGNGDAGRKIAHILSTIDIKSIQKKISYASEYNIRL